MFFVVFMLDANFWKKYFREYDLLNKLEPYDNLLNQLCEAGKPEKGKIILDAGTGTGNLARKISERGAEVIGVDFSKEGLEIYKKKIPNSENLIWDLTKTPLPFPDSRFDAIVSNNTIYALPTESRPPLFKDFYRILKPGGKIAIANVHKGFKPLKIYLEHLKWSFKNKGWIKTFFEIIQLAIPTLKIFYYNYLIKKENRNSKYSFVESGEQKKLLESSGFKNISSDKYVYANQGILNFGEKVV